MGGRDLNYQIVYRGEELEIFREGGWVFFQRLKEYGGGFWLGRTYGDTFIFGIEKPISLRKGILFLNAQDVIEKRHMDFCSDDDPNLSFL